MHETTILTNREPSELVKTHLVCPPGKDTDYIRKKEHLKLFFVVYSTTNKILLSTIPTLPILP